MKALTDVHFRYYEVGTQLRLESKVLDSISTRSNSYAIAMDAVIEEWLKGNYNTTRFGVPTWKKLVEAVAHPDGGNNIYLAEKISKHKKNG